MSEAALVINLICERDDIGKLNIPPSGKRYARMSGLRGMVAPRQRNLYTKMVADLVNRGVTKGFKNRDAAGSVGNTLKEEISVDMLEEPENPLVLIRDEDHLMSIIQSMDVRSLRDLAHRSGADMLTTGGDVHTAVFDEIVYGGNGRLFSAVVRTWKNST